MAGNKWKTAMGNAIDAAKDSLGERERLEGHEVQAAGQQRSAAFLQAAAGKRRQVVEYSVDPRRCRMWTYHNRLQDYIDESNCSELIESIRVNGQRQPALARELREDPQFDYELIYGARRRYACELLGIDLRIRVTRMDDKAALAEMDAENRPRKDISDYERALDYRRWLDKGLYNNQNELCGAIGVSKSWLSRVLRMAELPEQVVDAFPSPLDLKVEYGYELARAVEDQEVRKRVLRRARELKGQQVDAAQVFRQLRAVVRERPRESRGVLEAISNEAGTILFKVARDRNGLLQLRFEKAASKRPKEEIRKAVLDALDRFI